MSDETPQPRESKLAARVEQLEKTLKAVLVAVGEIENQTDVQAMPEGCYYGIKFE